MRASPRILSSLTALWPLLLILAVAAPARAQAGEQAARELAEKILAVTGAHPSLLLSVQNLSSLGVIEVAAARHALEAELERQGARLVASPAAGIEVRVTLSENAAGLLWVAQIPLGESFEVAMVALPPSATLQGTEAQPSLALFRKLVWRQDAPVLDFQVLDAPEGKGQQLWVLEPERLALYHADQGRWVFDKAAQTPHQAPWPRDLRGKLFREGPEPRDRLSVALPDRICATSLAESSLDLKLDCLPIDANRPEYPILAANEIVATANLATAKNFFGPAIRAAKAGPIETKPFFSAAAVPDSADHLLFVAAHVDGSVAFYDESWKQVGAAGGWGSDVAAVKSGCGSGWQVLATRPGDWTVPDAVQAFEIVERQAVAASDPVEFPGPVTALWPAAEGTTAIAVVRNLKTEAYEVYSLVISCGH